MKKHLLAAAVAAAVTAPAMAQNVSLYGALDASYVSHSVTTTTTAKIRGVADSAVQSSLFGIRGSEDLGGGLKAVFNLEADINLTNGQTRTDAGLYGSATTAKLVTGIGAADAMFRRAAFVGLQTGYGEVTFGRRISPAIANSQALSVLGGNSVASANQVAQGTAVDFFTRNAVTYVSPTFNGATVTLQQGVAGGLVQGAAGTDTVVMPALRAGTQGAFASTAAAVSYASGPLSAGVGTQTVKNATGGDDHSFWNARVSYQIGAIKLGYGTQKVNATATTAFNAGSAVGPNLDNTSNVMSVSYDLSNTTTAGLSYIDNNRIGTLTNLQLRNALSKRTTVYGQFGQSKRDATSATSAGFSSNYGFATSQPSAGKSGSSLGVGVIHSF